MKFVLAETPRYWWPVTVRMPHPEAAGQIIEQQLDILFEPQGQDAALDTAEAAGAATSPRDFAEQEQATLRAICRDWRGVVDDATGDVPFSDTAFSAAIQMVWFRQAVFAAYRESLTGEAARLGN